MKNPPFSGKNFFLSKAPALAAAGFILLGLGLAPLLIGQDEPPRPVLLKKDRESVLENAENILHAENPGFLTTLLETHSPFLPPLEEVVEVVQETPEGPRIVTKPVAPKAPPKIPDADILRYVADRLNPKGSLVTSRRSLLLFPNGGKLTVGGSIPTKVRGKDYTIIVADITPNNYTLRLNEARITRSFKITSSKGAVRKD